MHRRENTYILTSPLGYPRGGDPPGESSLSEYIHLIIISWLLFFYDVFHDDFDFDDEDDDDEDEDDDEDDDLFELIFDDDDDDDDEDDDLFELIFDDDDDDDDDDFDDDDEDEDDDENDDDDDCRRQFNGFET
jgi:hypothetical protein